MRKDFSVMKLEWPPEPRECLEGCREWDLSIDFCEE